MDGTNVSVVWNKADETPRMTRNHVRWCEMNTLLSTLTSLSGTNWNSRKAGPKGVGLGKPVVNPVSPTKFLFSLNKIYALITSP